jgi:plastocyanin
MTASFPIAAWHDRGVRRILALVLLGSLLAAAAAYADQTVTARPPNQFASSTTTIAQGEKVDLQNIDIVAHDVVSRRRSDDNKPLFRSELIDPGDTGPVKGTEYLTTGSYPFFCSVHPGMEATLEVTSEGQPAARPDPPKVTVAIKSGDLQRVVSTRKLKVAVSSTKASVKLSARTRSGKLGSKTVSFHHAEKRTVAISLTRSGRNRLRGRSSAKVTVTAVATDAAGQTGKDTATRTLR